MKKGAFVLSFVLMMPMALALEGPSAKEMSMALGMAGKALQGILNNEYALYFVTVLLAFILFYVVYATPARNVRFFQGEGGLGLNRAGQLFCIALSGLTCTAIFAMKADVMKSTGSFLRPYGFFGGITFAILIFLLVWRGFRDQHMLGLGNFALGFIGGLMAWMFFGFLVGDPNMLAWGLLFLVIFLICLIVRAFWRRTHHGLSPHAVRQAQRGEDREIPQAEQAVHQQQEEAAQDQRLLEAERREQITYRALLERDQRIRTLENMLRLRQADREGEG